MEFLEHALVVVHFVGLASLLGGFLVQIPAAEKVVNRAMVDGALTQLVTGLALVGVLEAMADDGAPVDHAKVGVKLLVLVVVLGLVWVNRKKASVSTGVWTAIGGLTLLNVVVAVFWT
jgi:hypothetical protein